LLGFSVPAAGDFGGVRFGRQVEAFLGGW
jgi:hypothetical protein